LSQEYVYGYPDKGDNDDEIIIIIIIIIMYTLLRIRAVGKLAL